MKIISRYYDFIIDVTWNNGKINLNQGEMEQLFLELPEDMRLDAKKWGMSDTPWRDELGIWYKRNKMNHTI